MNFNPKIDFNTSLKYYSFVYVCVVTLSTYMRRKLQQQLYMRV